MKRREMLSALEYLKIIEMSNYFKKSSEEKRKLINEKLHETINTDPENSEKIKRSWNFLLENIKLEEENLFDDYYSEEDVEKLKIELNKAQIDRSEERNDRVKKWNSILDESEKKIKTLQEKLENSNHPIKRYNFFLFFSLHAFTVIYLARLVIKSEKILKKF